MAGVGPHFPNVPGDSAVCWFHKIAESLETFGKCCPTSAIVEKGLVQLAGFASNISKFTGHPPQMTDLGILFFKMPRVIPRFFVSAKEAI